MTSQHIDLFDPTPLNDEAVHPRRPRVLSIEEWAARDYRSVYAWRMRELALLRADPMRLSDARAYYSTRPKEFICDWLDTYNPRLKRNKWMPFILFKRQGEFIDFLESLRHDSENGLIEKARDMGASWLGCAYSVWCLTFQKDTAIGWGSRKEDSVDKKGDPDSLFEKMRLLINRMPEVFRPDCRHAFLKITNEQNGSTLTGEAGDNIGRGGRKTAFFVDEAQPLTAKIMTPFGWQAMSDISVGSLVADPEGGWQQVIHINDCGEHETFRVEFTDGTLTDCSENHLWSVQHHRTGEWSVKPLSEIVRDYRYETSSGTVQYRYRVPVTKALTFCGHGEYPLDPYIVGALIGDGSVGGVPEYGVKLTTVDIEIVDQFRRLLPEGVVIRQTGGTAKPADWNIGDIRGRTGSGTFSRARQAVVAAGIAGLRSWDKHIPDMYKYGSTDARWALLQGLMDTDGSAAKNGAASFYSCSKQLSDDVAFLVRSLGGTAVQAMRSDARGFRDQHIVHIAVDDMKKLFRLSRKLDRVKQRTKCKNKAIRSITPLGKQTVRCISVDGASQTYLTDDLIVTHNSAHIERAELLEASLGDTTDVRIDMSSVNGVGNMFHRRREAGEIWSPDAQIDRGMIRVFIFDWRDHPDKTQEWYDTRKAKHEREGTQHVFAQEVDRNYSAAVENTVIQGEWVDAAIDAHLHVPAIVADGDDWMGGLDLADEGGDKNALVLRQGVVLRYAEEWGERDPGATTRRVIQTIRERQHRRLAIQYDSIGIGTNVKSEFNRLIETGDLNAADVRLVPWNAGAAVLNPYDRVIPDDEGSILNRAMFHNFKAQAWWALRTRFYKVWRARTLGDVYRSDELISIDRSSIPVNVLATLRKELVQPIRKMSGTSSRMVVDKSPGGARSPNIADATVQAFFPANDGGTEIMIGSMRG